MTIYTTRISSPIGGLRLTSDGVALTGLYTPSGGRERPRGPSHVDDEGPFRVARAELEQYFAGERRKFTLLLAPLGTEFERAVWRALLEIPHGMTLSYQQLAIRVGRPGAARAVGRANAHNPIAVIVPCHRVIGADGSLTGYAGGVEIKRWLLEHEASVAGKAHETPLGQPP